MVFVSRARSFVWCVTPRGAGAFKSQAAAAAWWDVAWYVGRTKRHGGARHRVLHREQTFSTENRIHVIRKLVPGLRTASDKASVASQCSLLPRRTIRSTGKGAIARRFKPALHAVSPH